MRRARIEFLIILILTALLFLFLGGYVFLFIFCFVLLLPFVSYIAMRIGRERVSLKLLRSNNNLYIRIKKHSYFPFGYLSGSCTIDNMFYQTKTSQDIFSVLDERNKRVILQLNGADSGVIKICINALYITDMLGLFHYPINSKSVIRTVQMPNPIHEESSVAWIKNFFQEGDPLNTGFGQELSDDAYDVREYEPGDSVHRIHYKLSFKLSKFMIRYFERSDAGVSALFLDFSELADCEFVLSTSILAMKQLLSVGYKLQVYWISEYEKHQFMVNQNEDVSACIYEILSMPRNTVKPIFSKLPSAVGAYMVNGKGIEVSSNRREAGEVDES